MLGLYKRIEINYTILLWTPEYHISTVLYVEKRNLFFFWYRVCYYAVSLFLYIFRIPNLSLVVNDEVIGCFPAHENTFSNKCQYHNFPAVVNIVWRSECCSCSNESKSVAIFSYETAEYHISTVLFVENEIFFLLKSCVLQRNNFILVSFCIPIHSLVLNHKDMQCFSAHEDAFYESVLISSFVQLKLFCLT
jgi:hypothetical protein